MSIILKTGFVSITHNIKFQPQTLCKGKLLVSAGHVRDAEELRTNQGQSSIFQARIIRQTSVTLTPYKMLLEVKVPSLVTKLAAILKCELDVCKFEKMYGNPYGVHQCFVRYTGKMELQEAVDRIKQSTKFKASIPSSIPDISKPCKGGKLKLRTRVALRIPTETIPVEILKATQRELMRELQLKYTGLYNLSRKTGHLLLEDISRTLYERLKSIMDSNPDKCESCFILSQTYRKFHPHFGDFHMILAALHKLEDAAGQARTQLSEQDLIGKATLPALMNNMSLDKVREVCIKYSERINKKILVHLRGLDSEPNENDSEEVLARKKVRHQLKFMAQFIPTMIKQVVAKQFIPQKAPFHRITVYGEPFLASKLILAPIMKKHRAVKIRRSDRIHNMVKCNIPKEMFSKLAEFDGKVLNGSKLIIRSSDAPLYKPTKEFAQEIRALYGIAKLDEDGNHDDYELMDEDDDEMKMESSDY